MRMVVCFVIAVAICIGADAPKEWPAGDLETVATFEGPMPTGVTVSKDGRIFVNFPRWGDAAEFTVAEVKNGKAVAYPNAEINQQDMQNQAEHFISVQSVVADSRDRLWVLDTGSPLFAPTSVGGPKLVAIDLKTNQVVKKILFPQDLTTPETYLNDVRFDWKRGDEGMAYITDSGQKSANGILVVDLASGKAWRRLGGHASVKADPAFVAEVEGRQVWQTDAAGKRTKWAMGSDGIAIDPANKLLYYCPLSSRHLFSVSLDALSDPNRQDGEVASTVKDLGEKGASDGLESDGQGRVYASDYEHNAIHLRTTDGYWWTVAHDPRMLWPDTLSLAANGYLYFTCNQLHRQKQFHQGKDERQKPYMLFRVKVDGQPIAQ